MTTKIKTPTHWREANGWSVDIHPHDHAYDLWGATDDAIAYDATCLVFERRDQAEEFAAGYEDAGDIRPVYWINGPEGFVVWC